MWGRCSRLELARFWHGLSNMRGSWSQSQCQRGRSEVQRMPGITVLQSSPLCIQQQMANSLQAQDPREAVYKKTCAPQMHNSIPTPRDWGYKPTCVPACLCIMCMLCGWTFICVGHSMTCVCVYVCMSVVVCACLCLGVFVWVLVWVSVFFCGEKIRSVCFLV